MPCRLLVITFDLMNKKLISRIFFYLLTIVGFAAVRKGYHTVALAEAAHSVSPFTRVN